MQLIITILVCVGALVLMDVMLRKLCGISLAQLYFEDIDNKDNKK